MRRGQFVIVAMPLRVKGRLVAVRIVSLRNLRSIEEHLASCAIVRPQTPHYLRMTSSFSKNMSCHLCRQTHKNNISYIRNIMHPLTMNAEGANQHLMHPGLSLQLSQEVYYRTDSY